MKKTRLEKDILGTIKIPINAYYGAQTQRALDNFPISGLKSHQVYISSIAFIKKAAAITNNKLNLLNNRKAEAIITACDEILKGKFCDQFIVDIYQAGAGTSHNMNVNEIIANRANEILGAPLGSYKYIHPNDDVNMSQSTNDVIPTAIRISCLFLLPKLLKSLNDLAESFSKKSKEFSGIIKSGRTHLQDALPVTLGQEFEAYAKAISYDRQRIEKSAKNLLRIGIGGTAVGTGINTHPKYHLLMISELKKLTKLPLKSSGNLFESMQNTADFLDLSGSLCILSQTLIRIGNDLRLLSSGPRTGFAEVTLFAVQPGSSIMPGKVNPGVVEMLTMVCFQVIGFDQAILLASVSGQLELNVWLPLIAYNLLEQIRLLTNAVQVFEDKCVSKITANENMCRFWLERSLGIAAILNPYLGYEKVVQLVKEALNKNISIKELIKEKKFLNPKIMKKIFEIKNLTRPNIYK
ncbi:aspartate ammonia-lyase [Candidatus Gottesmanbacteria bacterium]|nr:aspartate ammonia-lyase [Candidatus Gottesmanbacteria bacterium]